MKQKEGEEERKVEERGGSRRNRHGAACPWGCDGRSAVQKPHRAGSTGARRQVQGDPDGSRTGEEGGKGAKRKRAKEARGCRRGGAGGRWIPSGGGSGSQWKSHDVVEATAMRRLRWNSGGGTEAALPEGGLL